MTTTCNHCEGTGFLNADQFPKEVTEHESRVKWLQDRKESLSDLGGCSCHISPPCSFCTEQHDIVICDCCGDGDAWHGQPGEHYGPDDQPGSQGPYADNGGLCQCH